MIRLKNAAEAQHRNDLIRASKKIKKAHKQQSQRQVKDGDDDDEEEAFAMPDHAKVRYGVALNHATRTLNLKP